MVKAKTFNTGDRVKVVANTAGHNQTIGRLGTVSLYVPNNKTYQLTETPGFSYYAADLELTTVTVKDITEKIASLRQEISTLEARLRFMKENKLEEYDSDIERTMSILSVLEDINLTNAQKAMQMVKIIKS